MDFSDWINEKYYTWRGKTKRGITEYAKHLGIPQSLMSEWMKPKNMGGKQPRSQKYISVLFEHYGDEVYKILNLPQPEDPISSLPPPMRKRLRKAQKEIEATFKERGLTGEMPEAERLAIKIMEKHGFKYIETEELPDT
jgi:hypothetical protein